ncbi:MAG: phosphoesterase, partial [Pedosphaera sp.]|nr:phosphoesterase [Pedosphaera sp.]
MRRYRIGDCLARQHWHFERVNWLSSFPRRAGSATAVLATGLCLKALAADSFATREAVGPAGTNRWYTPANQILTPAGVQVELPGLRPQALALSPDGRLLVTAGKTHELVVIDPRTGIILQRVALPSDKARNPDPVAEEILAPDTGGQLSFTGLAFSPDGGRIYLANVNGSIKVFTVGPGGKVAGLFTMALPPATGSKRDADIPAGLAVSADGKRLYVALNLSNRLAEMDTATGKVLRVWEVGVAPFDVAVTGGKVYVSNWGGRRPDANSVTGPAGQGTRVRVDPVREIASEGSVSVIELSEKTESRKQKAEIVTGLHASALAVSPGGRHVVVANAGSDTLTVIDTRTDKIIETIWTRQNPGDLFGAQPNALAFDPGGKKLFVCNGTQNAVAVVDFKPGKSELRGLIPVGWFPGGVAYDAKRRAIYVANIKGIGSTAKIAPGEAVKFNSHQSFGTLSLLPEPSSRELARLTKIALVNMRHGLLRQAMLPPRANQPPRPVPERAGEPGVFKHVVYLIKENRTYDQVLGDMKEGNGDASLCIFPERITPNQHKLCRDFVLLDNTYCSGINSADGHQWTDSAIASDYIERSFAGFPRSYPYWGGDALAFSPAGFIWDNVLAHGRTLRNYGEFTRSEIAWRDPKKSGNPRWLDHYRDFLAQSGQISIKTRATVASLQPHECTSTVGFDMNVSDQFRAAEFLKEFREYERNDNFPNFIIFLLSSDHTSGTKPGSPTPAAMVADNDLAFGKIVEAISHSKFWKDTCIFAIEDDPQAGWDHVSGYRTTAYVASAYTKRGAVIGTQYNHTSLLRTMELMLGLPPMNQ